MIDLVTMIVLGLVVILSMLLDFLNVLAEIERKPQNPENLLLPLSVVTISQNESYIFVAENSKAKKVSVSVVKVQGEFVEVKTDISSSSSIITNGSKLVRDGEEVIVEN